MEENNEVVCDETFKEIDQNIVKKLPKTEIQETELVLIKEEHPVPKRGRGRPRKNRLDVKSQSSTTSKVNYTVDSKMGLKKIRYRPIRPKPLPPGASLLRHKMFGAPLMLNMSTLTSNRVVVTVPNKDKTQNVALDDLSKTTIDNNVTRSIISQESNTNERAIENANIKINTEKGLRKAKTVSHLACKSSIELFFESMAQTVLNLPMEVQAEIKMKICKLVTMAEMKYCGSLMKSKTD